jgi:hypothetical protein
MTNLLVKIRDIIADNYQSIIGADVQDYISSKIFTLQYSNIDSATLIVYKNGVLWSGSNYSYDAGIVTITGTLTAGDSLRFDYNAYAKYSDAELQGYIRSALYYLTAEKYKTFVIRPPTLIMPTPSEDEECLIAIIAAILIKGSIREYRTPEFSISFGESISVEEKIREAVSKFKKSFGYLGYIDLSEQAAETEEDEE